MMRSLNNSEMETVAGGDEGNTYGQAPSTNVSFNDALQAGSFAAFSGTTVIGQFFIDVLGVTAAAAVADLAAAFGIGFTIGNFINWTIDTMESTGTGFSNPSGNQFIDLITAGNMGA